MFTDTFYAASNKNTDTLLAALTDGSAQLTQKTQQAMQAYLCEILHPQALTALCDELRGLADTQRLQWTPFRLPGENLAAVGVWTAPLLAWGLNQPWADSISFEAVSRNWAAAQISTGKMSTAYGIDMLHAMHYLGQRDDRLNAPALHAHLLEASTFKWKYIADSFHYARRASLEVSGLSASLCGPPHRDAWLRDVTQARDPHLGTNYGVFVDILESDLPRDLKIAVAVATPKYWLNDQLLCRIQDCLPIAEKDRLLVIPWKEASGNGLAASPITVEYTSRKNEELMHAYCPAFHSVLSSLATQEDWSNPAWILELAGSCSDPSAQVLSLPLEFTDAAP